MKRATLGKAQTDKYEQIEGVALSIIVQTWWTSQIQFKTIYKKLHKSANIE